MTRSSIDSNILIYATDARDLARQAAAIRIMSRAPFCDCMLTPQSLAELFHAVTRKRIIPALEAMTQLRRWLDLFPVTDGPTGTEILAAANASGAGKFQFYDALLLATAGVAGCASVISEDMHAGAWLGTTQVVAAFDPSGAITPATRTLLGLPP